MQTNLTSLGTLHSLRLLGPVHREVAQIAQILLEYGAKFDKRRVLCGGREGLNYIMQ